MTEMFRDEEGALVVRYGGECLRIEPHGPDALRVRARPGGSVTEPHVSALLPAAPVTAEIGCAADRGHVVNGRIRADVRLTRRLGADVAREPVIVFTDTATGQELLREARPHFAGPAPRSFKPLAGGAFQLEASFAAAPGERIMGLGVTQGRESSRPIDRVRSTLPGTRSPTTSRPARRDPADDCPVWP